MARRRRSAGPEVSLFPFLSILACLIGALTILIVALSVSEVMEGRNDESVARAEDYVILEREVAARRDEIVKREEDLQRSNSAVAELAEVMPRLEKVREDLKRLAEVVPRRDPLERQLEESKEKREELRNEKNKVEAGLVAGKERLGELARQLSKGLPLKILPTSEYFRRLAPVFVEAREEGIVVHSPSKVVTIPRGEIGSNAAFKQTVDYVAAEENRIIIFLVREDARATFMAAEGFAREQGAVTSKVPLLGRGDVDLKEFFNKR